jgi:REP element-mobilizing transposase RayT
MSYTNLTYHIVFATYRREKTINVENERLVYKAIYDIATSKGSKIYRIGGMPDHIHILISIPSNISISELVKVVKQQTSKYIGSLSQFPHWNGWENGYGGFTVSYEAIDNIIRYISSQKTHHAKLSFNDEFLCFLKENGLEMDGSGCHEVQVTVDASQKS